jgi:hypothetical protein
MHVAKVNILATKVRRFFSIFVLIPISYVRSIVPPLPTVSRKQNMAGKGQYFWEPCMGHKMGLQLGMVECRLVGQLITMIQANNN